MIKKNLFLIFAGCFALVVGLTAMEKAYSCYEMTSHGIGSHNVDCPEDACWPAISVGIDCSYCDGTGESEIPNGGGCNTAWYDNTFDCGNWYNGTCSFGGDCTDATEGIQCMEPESVGAC